MTEEQTIFRWRKVLIALLVLLPIIAIATGLGTWGLHQARVWMADGVWCIDVTPTTGEMVKHYGDEQCQIESPAHGAAITPEIPI